MNEYVSSRPSCALKTEIGAACCSEWKPEQQGVFSAQSVCCVYITLMSYGSSAACKCFVQLCASWCWANEARNVTVLILS